MTRAGDHMPEEWFGLAVVHPHPIEREALAALIEQSDDPGCPIPFAAVADAKELREVIEGYVPGLCGLVALVVVQHADDHEAYGAMQEIRTGFLTSAVVGYGPGDSGVAVGRALRAGASGYVDRGAGVHDLIETLCDAIVCRMHIAGPESAITDRPAFGTGRSLTCRQREVLELAAHGLTDLQVARLLGMSRRTATTHMTNIFHKLGTPSRAAAVGVAMAGGLIGIS